MKSVPLLLGMAALLMALALLLLAIAQQRARNGATMRLLEERRRRCSPDAVALSRCTASAALIDEPATLAWDELLMRAGIRTGWRMPLLAFALGLSLAAVAAVQLNTGWAIPTMVVAYMTIIVLSLQYRIEARKRIMTRQLPDFLDHMTRLTARGDSLQMSFQTASAPTAPPLRNVLDAALRNARSGMELDRALTHACAPWRMDTLEMLSAMVGVCIRMGGRSEDVLQRLGDFMRDLHHARQELRANTAEIRMSAWVLGLLPPASVLVMALGSPDFFEPMLQQPGGQKLLLAALVLELAGGTLLYRLARSL